MREQNPASVITAGHAVDDGTTVRYDDATDDFSKLGTDVEAALDGLVESGRYPTREDVLREGVRLIQDREARLVRIDAAVSRGIEDAEAGRSEDAEVVLSRLRRKYEAIVAKESEKVDAGSSPA